MGLGHSFSPILSELSEKQHYPSWKKPRYRVRRFTGEVKVKTFLLHFSVLVQHENTASGVGVSGGPAGTGRSV